MQIEWVVVVFLDSVDVKISNANKNKWIKISKLRKKPLNILNI